MPYFLLLTLLLTTTPEPPAGTVILVPGIGGFDPLNTSAHWALPRAGVRHEVRDFIWTHGRGQFLKDLQDRPYCLQKSNELAAEVRRLKLAEPGRPVFLLGRSGGTGIVLEAAAQLPPGCIERIILLSAAVAPTYDLRPALRATRHELISFYSPADVLILGFGTSQFGTIDRLRVPSAGLRKFVIPKGLPPMDAALYDRLVQIPWSPRMIWEGHTGGHAGTRMPVFLTKEVAPWLKP
jgi:pimeloyl-ACP methyl ester carboxylesterase